MITKNKKVNLKSTIGHFFKSKNKTFGYIQLTQLFYYIILLYIALLLR